MRAPNDQKKQTESRFVVIPSVCCPVSVIQKRDDAEFDLFLFFLTPSPVHHVGDTGEKGKGTHQHADSFCCPECGCHRVANEEKDEGKNIYHEGSFVKPAGFGLQQYLLPGECRDDVAGLGLDLIFKDTGLTAPAGTAAGGASGNDHFCHLGIDDPGNYRFSCHEQSLLLLIICAYYSTFSENARYQIWLN